MRVRLVFLYQGKDARDFANEEAAASSDVAEHRAALARARATRRPPQRTRPVKHLSCIDRDRQPPYAWPQRARLHFARIGENARKHKLREYQEYIRTRVCNTTHWDLARRNFK